MKKCVYFAENQKNPEEGAGLLPGYGFRPDGSWRGKPIPVEEIGLLLDDRCLPNQAGLAAACRALSAWEGIIILDFERPFFRLLAEFIKSLQPKRVVVPPSYSDYPHTGVLVGPWQGNGGYRAWLSEQQRRYGRIVLDAAPLCVQCYPGGRRCPWDKAMPETGYPCPALGCLHRRLPDGSILLWDTKQTLVDRLNASGVPAILFRSDWERI